MLKLILKEPNSSRDLPCLASPLKSRAGLRRTRRGRAREEQKKKRDDERKAKFARLQFVLE